MKALIEYSFNEMKFAFKSSKRIFGDESARNGLIHSGEFGAYRERIVAKFLKLILPSTFDIGSGFIITPNNECSTQCDVLIYNKEDTTLFTDQTNARLFPVETVVGFCEVKSDINSMSDLKGIIDKMSEIVKLRESMDSIKGVKRNASVARVSLSGRNIINMLNNFFERNPHGCLDSSCFSTMYYNQTNIDHQLMSLLICNKINCDIKDKLEDLNKYYISINFAPCAILSLQDGVILHCDQDSQNKGFFFNSCDEKLSQFNTKLTMLDQSNIDGVFKLINVLRQTVITTKTFEFDIVKYIQDYFR